MHSQSTQGVITGIVVSQPDARPLPSATIRYVQVATNTSGERRPSADGRYALPLLPPGRYRLRVSAQGYQSQDLHNLDLPVAGLLMVSFRLRRLEDVWEQNQTQSIFLPDNAVLPFFGPDVHITRAATVQFDPARSGLLEATFSQVVDPVLIRDLPLTGRDVYTMLVAQPGVASDGATSRGLGLSLNGQRPTSSNFLLDGIEHNNYQLSGPLTSIAPEAVQEYRVSTNSFSAEYGRTAGVIANAVTRSGSEDVHGLAYGFFRNSALNANDFQRNAQGLDKSPLRERQVGFFAGGPAPVWKQTFWSAALDHLRFRSREQRQKVLLPSNRFVTQTAAGSAIGELLRRSVAPYPDAQGPCVPSADQLAGCAGTVKFEPPSSLNRLLGLGRVDRVFGNGEHRLLFRVLTGRLERPNFISGPYADFDSPLTQNSTGIAASYVQTLSPRWTTETRLGIGTDDLRFDRAHADVPAISGPSGLRLPGSPLAYSYRNRSKHIEAVGNVIRTSGQHIMKAGGGVLLRTISGYQTAGADGFVGFTTYARLATDTPSTLFLAIPAGATTLVRPEYDRSYSHRQWYGFMQNSWRANSRLTFNYGVRYESLGAPKNTGAIGDWLITPVAGTLPDDLSRAQWKQTTPGTSLYQANRNDWAGRAGFAWSVDSRARTIIRGAFGIFYDRPFDLLWQTVRQNQVLLARSDFTSPVDYLNPRGLSLTPETLLEHIFRRAVLFQPGLRTPYTQSSFAGTRHTLTPNLSLEFSALSALGRKLLVNDIINRMRPRYTNNFGDLSYRSNQGSSSYWAGTAVLRYRGRKHSLQFTYTWSHAIDNQSDPINGELGDLLFAGITSNAEAPTTRFGRLASFTVQTDSRVDRGASTFDQRHSAALLWVWEPPAIAGRKWINLLTRDWKIAGMGSLRSGFPYSVTIPDVITLFTPALRNNRADVQIDRLRDPGEQRDGGRLLLPIDAFAAPANGMVGTLGRNVLHGPGFGNLDLSVSRVLPFRTTKESLRVVVRADAYNVLNHANLGLPNAVWSPDNRDFGIALYGRQGYETGVPSLIPFRETARQVQLSLRVEF